MFDNLLLIRAADGYLYDQVSNVRSANPKQDVVRKLYLFTRVCEMQRQAHRCIFIRTFAISGNTMDDSEMLLVNRIFTSTFHRGESFLYDADQRNRNGWAILFHESL